MRKVVVGLGNPLFGDDGFGIRVVEELEGRGAEAELLKGTPELLLDFLLAEERGKLVVIDVMDSKKKPGSLSVLRPSQLPPTASMRISHSLPLVQLLQEIERRGVMDVWLIACQPGRVTTPYVSPKLSRAVEEAVPRCVELVFGLLGDGQSHD